MTITASRRPRASSRSGRASIGAANALRSGSDGVRERSGLPPSRGCGAPRRPARESRPGACPVRTPARPAWDDRIVAVARLRGRWVREPERGLGARPLRRSLVASGRLCESGGVRSRAGGRGERGGSAGRSGNAGVARRSSRSCARFLQGRGGHAGRPRGTAAPDRFDRVVIDAGHGGDDQGAGGPNGLPRKEHRARCRTSPRDAPAGRWP